MEYAKPEILLSASAIEIHGSAKMAYWPPDEIKKKTIGAYEADE